MKLVSKAWVSCDEDSDGAVFAACPLGNGDVEIYGYAGSSDDCGFHDFADRAEAIAFARNINRRGGIDFDDFDAGWVRTDVIDKRYLDLD